LLKGHSFFYLTYIK